MVLLAGFMLVSATSNAQDDMPEALFEQMWGTQLRVNEIAAQIEVAEREVAVYDKSIRQNERIQEKMKDKEHRLKYKVMSELSKMDTTVPHKMTYKEWKLEKAQRERAHATAQLAKAQQSRQEKVLYLGDKTQELEHAREKLTAVAAAFKRERVQDKDPNARMPKSGDSNRKLRRTRERGYIETR